MYEHASINRIYRLVWDALRQTWVAVSEATRGRGKRKRVAASALLAASSFAIAASPPAPAPTALPQGGQVVAGQAAIAQSGTRLDITQTSNRAAINWQSFNIGQAAQVNFQQPSSSSVTLNRVLDGNASQIFGRLTANGQVFLSNPAGVYFSPSSSVDVGALSATTRSIGDAEFMAGANSFAPDNAAGAIVAAGLIRAQDHIALAAASVRVEGRLDASSLVMRGGRILLEAQDITLASGSTLDARGASGGGEVLVGGGWQGSGGLQQATHVSMENGASIDASATQAGDGGSIVLWSDVQRADSATRVYGSLTAEGAAGGAGGRIETSGHWLDVKGARVSAGARGQWLLDPYDVDIIASSGDTFDDGNGNFVPSGNSSSVGADDIVAALENGTSVTISTGSGGGQPGNITVNAPISKAAGGDATLTLQAANSISVNQAIGSSVGKLHVVLNADSDGTTLGAILVAAAIQSNGGNITLGGGANAGSYAEADGVSSGALSNTGVSISSTGSLDAGGGNIVMRGSGTSLGIEVLGTVKTSGAGTIGLYGRGMASQTSTAVQIGDMSSDGLVQTANGDITIEGSVPSAQTTGINIFSTGSAIASTGTGSLGLSAPGMFGSPNGRFDSSGLISVGGDVNVTQLGSFNPSFGNDFQIGGVLNMNVSGNIGNVHSSGALKLGTISAVNSIYIDTLSGDLTLTGAISTADTSDFAITLGAGQNEVAGTASGGSILVSGGSLSVGTGGRATLYTGSVDGSTGLATLLGSGSGRFRYNSDSINSGFATPLSTGSYAIYREQPTLSLSASGSGTVEYGSAVSAALNTTGQANGDTLIQILGDTPLVTLSGATSSAGYATVGSHTATLGSVGTDKLGYNVTTSGGSGSITVTAKTISASGITAQNKTYDGTTTATLNTGSASLDGALADDDVGLGSISGSFVNRNAGNGIAITVSGGSLTGADAGNYQLGGTLSATGNILPKSVTLAGIANASKVYDGSTSAAGTNLGNASFNGVLQGDSLTLANASGSFDSKNAGSRTLTLSGMSLGGSSAGNYTLGDSTAQLSASITPKPLGTTGSFSASDKVYDGSTAASVDLAALHGVGVAGGDTVLLGGSGAFADANAGTGKTVTLTLQISGADAGNYSVAGLSPPTATANITPALLTLTAGAASKAYDGSTALTNGSYTLSGGRLYGSASIVGVGYAFDNRNAGEGKTVSITTASVDDGNGGANYTLSYLPNTASRITPAPLTLTAADLSKVYDGSTTATGGTLLASGGTTLFGSDSVSGGSFAFADRNAGTGKTLTVSGGTVNDGNQGRNYTVSYASNTGSTITRAPLTLTSTDVTKVFDGSTSVTGGGISVVSGTLYSPDALGSGTWAYTDPSVGQGNKTVTLSGVSLNDGNGGANYAISYRDNTSSTITVRQGVDAGTLQGGTTSQGNTYAPVNSGVTTSGGVVIGLVTTQLVSDTPNGPLAGSDTQAIIIDKPPATSSAPNAPMTPAQQQTQTEVIKTTFSVDLDSPDPKPPASDSKTDAKTDSSGKSETPAKKLYCN